jgi:hypothetical protein
MLQGGPWEDQKVLTSDIPFHLVVIPNPSEYLHAYSFDPLYSIHIIMMILLASMCEYFRCS